MKVFKFKIGKIGDISKLRININKININIKSRGA